MVLFDFKSDKHFVASSDKTTLHVYELTNATIHPSRIRKTHWREVASVTPAPDHHDGGDDDEDQSDADEDDAAAAAEEEEEESYSGLMFFDGYGKIEGQQALTKLAQHLTRLRLIVSPQGHSFEDVSELGEHKDFGIHYLRLNDLFNWPEHGINMASVIMWRRVVLKYTVPKREKRPVTNGGVSKEKYEELKKMVTNKDKELGKLREEMEEQDKEIQMLKEEKEDASEQHEAELREMEKEKDEELRKLLKRKDDELQMFKKEIQTLKKKRAGASDQQLQEKLRELENKKDEELREMMKRKGDELQMLEKRKDGELKKNNDELKMLKIEKDDGAKLIKEKDEELKTLRDQVENLRKADKGDGAQLIKEKDEELKTSRDQMENLRKADKGDEAATAMTGKILVNSDEWHMLKKDKEALQKLMKEKSVESGKLMKEKEELTIANAAETRKLKDRLSQLQEQEQHRNQPWALTSATRYLSEYTIDVRTRRPVPQDTWRSVKIEVPRDHYYVYEPNITAASSTFPMINWIVVNEEPKDWPSPPKIGVLCQPGQFDKGNWWYVKTFHPDGRLAMLAYYDGSQTSYTNPNYKYPIRLAFPMNSKLYTTTPFFLIPLNGVNKLAFSYRD